MLTKDKDSAIEFLKYRYFNTKKGRRVFVTTRKVNRTATRRELSVYVFDRGSGQLDDISAHVALATGFKIAETPDRYAVMRHGVGFNVHADLVKRLSEVIGSQIDYQSI